jgi:hypothetical protein
MRREERTASLRHLAGAAVGFIQYVNSLIASDLFQQNVSGTAWNFGVASYERQFMEQSLF